MNIINYNESNIIKGKLREFFIVEVCIKLIPPSALIGTQEVALSFKKAGTPDLSEVQPAV